MWWDNLYRSINCAVKCTVLLVSVSKIPIKAGLQVSVQICVSSLGDYAYPTHRIYRVTSCDMVAKRCKLTVDFIAMLQNAK